MELVEFLRARLDEDEAAARGAAHSSALVAGRPTPPTRLWKHLARHDPARVLAEVEAKRRIVEWCSEREKIYVPASPTFDAPRPEDFVDGALKRPVDGVVLRLLALPYADHSDYDEGWKP